MKVKCIDESGDGITISKTYDVIDEDKWFYKIINNFDNNNYYNKSRFKTLAEIRNEIIDKLLEDES